MSGDTSAVNPTGRFSNRVEHYVKARPNYPPAVMEFLRAELGLRPEHRVADVGAGTGIFTEHLLRNGNTVFAVEPNDAMRSAAQRNLAGNLRLHLVKGTAEATGLEETGVDFIVAAQAFHWFDVERARVELRRILKPGGWVILMWNDRREDRPPFSVDYQRIVRAYHTDYDRVNHQNVGKDDSAALRQFFGAGGYRARTFDNFQDLDWDGVAARVFSSSYMPPPHHPRAVPMLADLRRAFEAHQQGGTIRIEYVTRAFFGAIS